MLNEKHNDPFGWKNKLESLTGLPGEAAPGKDAAWEKLQERLQQKPRRNRVAWYWAAAGILLACIIPLLTANKKEDIVVRSKTQPQNKIAPPLVLPLPVKETVTAAKEIEKRQVENRITKDQHITTSKTNLKKEAPVTVITQTNIEKDPVTIIIPAATTDTAAMVSVAAPAKKKLAVVHINELGSPSVQAFPPPNYVQAPFKIKFKSGKAANQTFASQQQYAGGFKIKLSSKN